MLQSCLKELLPRVIMKLSQETSSILENLAEILERVSIAMCSQWISSLYIYYSAWQCRWFSFVYYTYMVFCFKDKRELLVENFKFIFPYLVCHCDPSELPTVLSIIRVGVY